MIILSTFCVCVCGFSKNYEICVLHRGHLSNLFIYYYYYYYYSIYYSILLLVIVVAVVIKVEIDG
jgi:hypothetical protein